MFWTVLAKPTIHRKNDEIVNHLNQFCLLRGF
jgi:hypothetical protein